MAAHKFFVKNYIYRSNALFIVTLIILIFLIIYLDGEIIRRDDIIIRWAVICYLRSNGEALWFHFHIWISYTDILLPEQGLKPKCSPVHSPINENPAIHRVTYCTLLTPWCLAECIPDVSFVVWDTWWMWFGSNFTFVSDVVVFNLCHVTYFQEFVYAEVCFGSSSE